MFDWLRYPLIALCLVVAVAILRGQRRRSWAVSRSEPVPGEPVEPERTRRVMAVSVVGWVLVALAVAGTTGGGLLWFLGWPRLPSAAQFDVKQLLDLLKIALSVVAGFGGVVLLAVNYRKQRVAEDEHDLAVQRADREVVQKFNERLGSAAEQLAHESPAVRLTGVYALAGLADDWADKRQVCVDVLCGYLRVAPEVMTRGETEVRQAILREIRERTATTWRWLDFDFTGITFENADFARLQFEGAVLFDGAEFVGGVASFAGTEFRGVASFHGARFAAAQTTFAGMSVDGGQVEFVGAEFTGDLVEFANGWLSGRSIDFYRCRFAASRLVFTGFSYDWGQLRFEQCEFADLEFDLSGSTRGAGWVSMPVLILDECRLVRCRFDLTSVGSWARVLRTVLDTVTVGFSDLDGSTPAFRDVELRGGSTLPERLRQGAEESLDVPG